MSIEITENELKTLTITTEEYNRLLKIEKQVKVLVDVYGAKDEN